MAGLISPNGGAVQDSPEDVLRKHLPRSYKGPGWTAILGGIAAGDLLIQQDVQAAFDQLYVSTASELYLDRLASNSGLERPSHVQMSDERFRRLAIVSSSQKMTEKALVDLIEVFYGTEVVAAHLDTQNEGPYNIDDGSSISFSDGKNDVEVTFSSLDFSDISSATAEEVAAAITLSFLDQDFKAYAVVSSAGKVRVFSKKKGLGSKIKVSGGLAQNVLLFPNKIEEAVIGAAPTDSASGTIAATSSLSGALSATVPVSGAISATSSLTGTATESVAVPTPLIDFDAYDPSSYPGGDGATWTSIGTNGHTLSVATGAPTFNAGGWMEFNGSSSYKSVSTTSAFPSGSAVRTWQVLAYCTSATGSTQCAAGYGENISTGRLDCALFDATGLTGFGGFGGSEYEATARTGQWVCLTGRLASGSTLANVEWFVNGAAVAVSGTSNTINTSSPTSLAIGALSTGTAAFFTGRVMRFAIWDTALTDDQIGQIFEDVRGRVGL